MDFDDTSQNKKIIKNDLQLYSINLLKNNPDIKEKRKIGYIKDIFTENIDFDELELNPCNAARLLFSIPRSETVYTSKICREGDYMKWHCDDAIITSHKKNMVDKYINNIKISDKKTLFYPNKIPKYTLIVYGSTYKVDFKGGILEFSDGTRIKPEKNLCVFFDSREAHCVHRIREGVKKLMLIKFY